MQVITGFSQEQFFFRPNQRIVRICCAHNNQHCCSAACCSANSLTQIRRSFQHEREGKRKRGERASSSRFLNLAGDLSCWEARSIQAVLCDVSYDWTVDRCGGNQTTRTPHARRARHTHTGSAGTVRTTPKALYLAYEVQQSAGGIPTPFVGVGARLGKYHTVGRHHLFCTKYIGPSILLRIDLLRTRPRCSVQRNKSA